MYNQKEIKVTSTQTKNKNPWSKDKIVDPRGQWAHPGENTRIPSNQITMTGVPYPVMGVPNMGAPVMMMPGQDYNFPGADYVDEYPMMQEGGSTNFVPHREGSRSNPDGTVSSHIMAREKDWSEGEGWVVFPTLFQDEKGEWYELPREEAYKHAKEKGEMNYFGDNEQGAIGFADQGNWKKKNGGIMNYYAQDGRGVQGDPNEFERGDFDVKAYGINSYFAGQPGYTDYSAHVANRPHYAEAMSAHAFPVYQPNAFEEGTRDWKRQEAKNIRTVKRGYRQAKRDWRQGKQIDVFAYGGSLDRFIPMAQQGFEIEAANNQFDKARFDAENKMTEAMYMNITGQMPQAGALEKMPMIPLAQDPSANFKPIITPEEIAMQQYQRDMNAAMEMERPGQQRRAMRRADRAFTSTMDNMQDGGQFQEMELTDAEIAELRRQGYRVDEM